MNTTKPIIVGGKKINGHAAEAIPLQKTPPGGKATAVPVAKPAPPAPSKPAGNGK